MMLTHLTLAQDLALHHDLLWTDEHSWSPAVQNVSYSLTGALILETAARQAGRPITLQPAQADMAWHTRAVVDQLRAWAATPGQQFLLTLDDARAFTVVFRHQDGTAVEAKPVRGFPSWNADDYWQVSLKFMEV